MTARDFFHGGSRSGLRWRFLAVSAIIISNFFIGLFAPLVIGIDDEVVFFDTLWRVVVGQRAGIDYHTPMGLGPYYLGAVLWHWLGPHYYVLRLAIMLFSLSIAFCGCIVVERTLSRKIGLAWLFCVTLAFQLSAPTVFESDSTSLGMAGFYNRLIVPALAVLFLLTFGDRSRSRRENAVEILLIAFLLNILFLIKISGLIIGLTMLLASCLLKSHAARRVLNLCMALLVFTAATAIEFKVAGLEFIPVIQEYVPAARARLAISFYDIASGMLTWPLVSSVVLLLLFALSRRHANSGLDLRSIGLIIGSYAACQYALNMSNFFGASMWLAPAAVAILAACENSRYAERPEGNSKISSLWILLSRLDQVSVRAAIPTSIFIFVLAQQVTGSLFGVALGTLIALNIETTYFVTAGKGVSFKTILGLRSHVPPVAEGSYSEVITAISTLNLDHQAIANLDSSNPFPVLFLAPPPKGIHVLFDWGGILPRGTVLRWEDSIGDACVVTIPANSLVPDTTARLVELLRPKLETDFEVVYHSQSWKVYRRTRGCVTAPTSEHGVSSPIK